MEKQRYNLKMFSIGYEVPFLDLNNTDGKSDLVQSIVDTYKNWFDVLNAKLDILQLPNTNQLLLYYIIVRVDNDLINIDTFESDWTKMQDQVKQAIEKFLDSRNLIYKVLS